MPQKLSSPRSGGYSLETLESRFGLALSSPRSGGYSNKSDYHELRNDFLPRVAGVTLLTQVL